MVNRQSFLFWVGIRVKGEKIKFCDFKFAVMYILITTRGEGQRSKLRRIELDRCQWQMKGERNSVRYEQNE